MVFSTSGSKDFATDSPSPFVFWKKQRDFEIAYRKKKDLVGEKKRQNIFYFAKIRKEVSSNLRGKNKKRRVNFCRNF